MRSILEEFANGNISSALRLTDRDAKYFKVAEVMVQLEKKMLDRLGAEDKELFGKYLDVQGEAARLVETKHFVHGFKLGLVMAAEALVNRGDLCERTEL